MRFEMNQLDAQYTEIIVNMNGLVLNEGIVDIIQMEMMRQELLWFASVLEERIEDVTDFIARNK